MSNQGGGLSWDAVISTAQVMAQGSSFTVIVPAELTDEAIDLFLAEINKDIKDGRPVTAERNGNTLTFRR